MKEVIGFMDGTDRELVTVLARGNAAGHTLRRLILYGGQLHIGLRFDRTNSACRISANTSGVMDNVNFPQLF